MLHLLIALAGHSQLERLRRDLLPVIGEELRRLLSNAGARMAWDGEGILLAGCGTDARSAADLALRVHERLHSRRGELFGFAVVLHDLSSAPEGGPPRRLADEALALDPEDRLWVSSAAAGPFAGVLETRPLAGGLLVLGPSPGHAGARETGPRPGAAPSSAESTSPARVWHRDTLVERCLELLSRRLNDPESRAVVFVHGRPGAGKTSLIAEAARRLGGGGPVLRAYALFRRRTTLHPFLNGIDPSFIAAVPGHLSGPERGAWEDLGGILAAVAHPGSAVVVPDRVVTDFVQAYRLYARARVRSAERSFVPGIVVFENVESWHPAARGIAAALVDDLLAEPAAIPVVSSTEDTLPAEFSDLETAILPVPPLGRREIRGLARACYPGLELPEAAVRRIRGRTAGLPASVAVTLRCLAHAGSIRAGEDGHAWVQGRDADIPADALSTAWHLVRPRPFASRLVLFSLHLAAGLLDRAALLDFLETTGLERASADHAIDGLIDAGLAVDETCLAPVHAGLRRRLEERLGDPAARLAERFADHLVQLWESGAFRRDVLVFSYLARTGRTDAALRVLPGILSRKLDERDLVGARAFSDPERLGLVKEPDAAAGAALAVTCSAARLRAALLEERLEEAGGLVRELAHLARGGAATGPVAEGALASARYYLAVGDSASALDAVKRGLADAQDAGDGGAAAVREASLLMGATMLADGRLGEADEYAGMAEREAQEAGDRLGALRAGTLSAACHFLAGRLTRAGQSAGGASRIAAALGQREDELFLGFLTARVRFLLGDLEGCSVALQRCLCLAELYRVDAAEPVLDAWLARTMVYGGAHEAGTARLERLEPTREVRLFLTEASLFGADLAAAEVHAERGLAMPPAAGFPSPHGGCWRDGFIALEGRCFSLARSGAFLGRQLAALHGHLLARRGARSEAVGELGALVHGVRPSDNDPALHLYLHLYADALPERSGEDDKVTVLAKALKGLQERASRIDAPGERTAFLNANRWHRAIMDEARSRHLA
jgi:hypothetical protein